MGVSAIQPLPPWWVKWVKSPLCSVQDKDLIGTLFSKMAGQFKDNLKVNVLHHCDREGKRDLQRRRRGDRLSPLGGEG